MPNDTLTRERTAEDYSQEALLAEVKVFKREVAAKYEAMFHEPMPQRGISLSILLWFINLFDKDKQFVNELSVYLAEHNKPKSRRCKANGSRKGKTLVWTQEGRRDADV